MTGLLYKGFNKGRSWGRRGRRARRGRRGRRGRVLCDMYFYPCGLGLETSFGHIMLAYVRKTYSRKEQIMLCLNIIAD